GGDATTQSEPRNEGHPDHRPDGSCDVGRPGEGYGGRLQRLRHQAHRTTSFADQDRGPPGEEAGRTMSGLPDRSEGGDTDRTRRALLANLRHELRTPLNAVI